MTDLKEEDLKLMEACYLCGKLCAPKGLNAHIRSHTNITIFDCSECGHRFSTKKLLQQHKITHSTHYLCEECNGKYKDTEHLKSHKCIPVMEQRECQYCGKFCAPKGLVPHIRSHKNCKKYICDECGDKFSSKKNLKKHKVIAHKVNLQCDDCNGKFRDAERLKTHTCIYGKEKNHFCDSCGKAFFTKYDLNRHMIIHTNDKPFKCDICEKGFNQKSNRDNHYRTHTQGNWEKAKERKFVCEICFYAFGYKQHLKRHLLIHSNEKPYSCEICKKSFSQKSYLKIHAMIHTNEKPFKCDICHRRFPRKWKLVQHQRRHGAPEIFCAYCNKGFYMPSEYDRHLLTHTNSKPYICDICHKGFTARFSLQNHYQSHIKQSKRKSKTTYEVVKINKSISEDELHEDFDQTNEAGDVTSEKEMTLDNENFEEEVNYDSNERVIKYEVFEEEIEDENIDEEYFSTLSAATYLTNELDPSSYEKYLSEINFSNLNVEEGEYVEIEIPTHLIEEGNFFDPDNIIIQESALEQEQTSGALIVKLESKPVSCHICKKVFQDEAMLKNHKNEFIQGNTYICCACGKQSDSEEDILAHQKIHEISSKMSHFSFLTKEL